MHKSNKRPRHSGHTLLLFSALFLSFLIPGKLMAQIFVTGGGNYSSIRNQVNIENKHPNAGYYAGWGFQFYPFHHNEKLSIISEFAFTQKGYHQNLDKKYSFRFNYLSMPLQLSYSLSRQVAVQTGIELSKLLSTNIKQGKKTYNHFDAGLLLGISCFQSNRISCFGRCSYSLTNMLDYYDIDATGNFNGKIHDIKNICLSVGIKINLYNEKIILHHQ